ncbi:hypothetical protein SCA03_02460 [Streptomyces cacaoi]|uniref:Uncharacterized protein n=1 Tax=Streptomyces cacaoi TaxID=1898 RepID=A0A4Y3QQW8_STRCI|nr:hypothetical protein SCA03_02460 [Streptomyces cacaoi]
MPPPDPSEPATATRDRPAPLPPPDRRPSAPAPRPGQQGQRRRREEGAAAHHDRHRQRGGVPGRAGQRSGGGAEHELGAAEETGGGPRGVGAQVEDEGRRGGQDHPEAGRQTEQTGPGGREAAGTGGVQRHQGARGGQGDGRTGGEQRAEAHPPGQPAEQHTGQHGTGGVHREDETVAGGRQAEAVAEDERRAGDVGEQRAESAPHDEQPADEPAPPQQSGRRTERGPHTAGHAPLGGQRLGNPRADRGPQRQPGGGQRAEHQAPGADTEDGAPGDRRQHRRRHRDHAQRGEPAGRVDAGEPVADDGPSDDEPGTGGAALQQPGGLEHGQGPGERADRGEHGEQPAAHQEQPAPSHRVADRTEYELTGRDPHEAGGERELHGCARGVERGDDLREGGRVHVGGER